METDQDGLYHYAAKKNLLTILKEANKYDLNRRDCYGRSVIHYAALRGHLDALKLIITLGYVFLCLSCLYRQLLFTVIK